MNSLGSVSSCKLQRIALYNETVKKKENQQNYFVRPLPMHTTKTLFGFHPFDRIPPNNFLANFLVLQNRTILPAL